MKICGLDLSLTATGFCELGGALDRLITIAAGDRKGFQRWDEIRKMIVAESTDADLVVMEQIFSGTRMTQQELVQFHGVIQFSLWHRQVPVLLVAPATLKKFATGSGKADKAIILREIFRRWDIDAADEHQADAAVLARIGLCLVGQAEPEIEAQREVLAKLEPKMAAIRKAA
jgi:Holliday junction resolvasome RuvABC endonuclease subunit